MIPLLVLLQATLAIGVTGPATSAEYLALRVAESHGYFAEEGVRVSLRTQRAEGPAAEALARGRVDLAATSLDAALRLGHVAGAPPRLVFGLTRSAPVALLVPARPGESVKGLSDLTGRTVGIPAPGTPEHTHLVSVLSRAGVPLHLVSIQSLGEAGLVNAIESGRVAAGMIGEPWASRLIQDGTAVALVDLRDPAAASVALGGPMLHAAVFARADARLGDAELIPLARALLKAMNQLAKASPEDLAARLGTGVAGAQEDWRRRLASANAVAIRDGWVTREMLEASVDLVRRRSPIPTAVKLPRHLESLLLTEPLARALGRQK